MRSEKSFWDLPALGELPPKEKGEFYDAMAEDEKGESLLGFGGGNSEYFENPTFRVAIVNSDGSIESATGYKAGSIIKDTKINLFMEKYFAYAMPGEQFNLQLVVRTRHCFNDRDEPADIAHTLAVEGIQGDYVNYLGEPVFSHLKVKNMLPLDIAVNFIGDKKTDKLLKYMNNEYVKKGVQLVNTFNPVFGMVVGYVQSISQAVLQARKNQKITNQHITFRSSRGITSLPLVEGTYLLVQPKTNEKNLDFNNARFNPEIGRVLVNNYPLDRNHMILRIQKDTK